MEIGIPGTRREFLVMCSLLASGHRSFAVENTATIPTVDERLRALALEAPLTMRFLGTTRDECQAWQSEFAGKLRSLLGSHQPPQKGVALMLDKSSENLIQQAAAVLP